MAIICQELNFYCLYSYRYPFINDILHLEFKPCLVEKITQKHFKILIIVAIKLTNNLQNLFHY